MTKYIPLGHELAYALCSLFTGLLDAEHCIPPIRGVSEEKGWGITASCRDGDLDPPSLVKTKSGNITASSSVDDIFFYPHSFHFFLTKITFPQTPLSFSPSQ